MLGDAGCSRPEHLPRLWYAGDRYRGPSGQRSIVRCEPPRFYRTRLRPDGVPITDGGSIATDIRQCLVALEVQPKSVGRLGYAVVLDRIEQRELAECLASGLNEECSPSALVAPL